MFNSSITLIPGNLIHWTISDQKLGKSHKVLLSNTMIVWFRSGIILTSPILLYIPSTNSIMQQTHTWHFICYNLFASGWEYSRKQLFNPLLVWNSSHLAAFGVKIHESTVITSKFRPCWQSIWNFHWFVWIPVINMRSQSYKKLTKRLIRYRCKNTNNCSIFSFFSLVLWIISIKM